MVKQTIQVFARIKPTKAKTGVSCASLSTTLSGLEQLLELRENLQATFGRTYLVSTRKLPGTTRAESYGLNAGCV